jgi:hypothetical protein
MALTAAKDPKRAAPLAVTYLERFPSGAYAGHARSIVVAEKARP